MTSPRIIVVALPVPLYQQFDYLPAKTQVQAAYKPGVRVRVQFGQRKLIGLIVSESAKSKLPKSKLKHIIEVLDDQPVFDTKLFNLLIWTADYYQQPIGEVLFTALPSVLRKGKYIKPTTNISYQLTTNKNNDEKLKRAPKQQQIVELLKSNKNILKLEDINNSISNWHSAMNALIKKNLIKKIEHENDGEQYQGSLKPLNLNKEQQQSFNILKNKLKFI